MDASTITTLLEDLNRMAATLLGKDAKGLQEMKAELDEYVEKVTSKMAGPSKEIANREFEKCRVCARDWIKVYCDNAYYGAEKADILREDAMEFFFSVDERIIAVQKNFFLLGMVDEMLNPSEPFSDVQRQEKAANATIRIMARKLGMKATCKAAPDSQKEDRPGGRLWYFGDDRNYLQSSEDGLNDREAMEYLQNKSE